MLIKQHRDVTAAVLAELQRAEDPRFRELMGAAVRHLHDFAREVQLTEPELQQVCSIVAQLGQLSTESHNEVVLAAGSLGLSALVCLLNNGSLGQTETTANMLGPFWRLGAPEYSNGASIVLSPTPGDPVLVQAWVRDAQGHPVVGAKVDVWQASSEGFYENQDPGQADMNLRGKFTTDAQGRVAFRSVKPSGYPIPLSGPVGALLRAQGRHNMRPAHIHFMIVQPGFKTQFSQVYSSDDPNLGTDVQFGVTQALIGQYVLHQNAVAPDPILGARWYSLDHTFVIEPGVSRLPRPPISGKASGERPQLAVLQRG